MLKERTCFSLILFLLSTKLAAECAGIGPWDYTNTTHIRDCLPTVEKYHLNADVENLKRGVTVAFPAEDLYFILRSFPNHHRALYATSRLWRKHTRTGTTPPGAPPNQDPHYLFDRAIRFAPHDATVHMLYGIHLYKSGELDSALTQYKAAEKMQPESAEIHYNLGLLYYNKKEYDSAERHARKAYSLGYPLPGLRAKLIESGVWSDSTQ